MTYYSFALDNNKKIPRNGYFFLFYSKVFLQCNQINYNIMKKLVLKSNVAMLATSFLILFSCGSQKATTESKIP